MDFSCSVNILLLSRFRQKPWGESALQGEVQMKWCMRRPFTRFSGYREQRVNDTRNNVVERRQLVRESAMSFYTAVRVRICRKIVLVSQATPRKVDDNHCSPSKIFPKLWRQPRQNLDPYIAVLQKTLNTRACIYSLFTVSLLHPIDLLFLQNCY